MHGHAKPAILGGPDFSHIHISLTSLSRGPEGADWTGSHELSHLLEPISNQRPECNWPTHLHAALQGWD